LVVEPITTLIGTSTSAGTAKSKAEEGRKLGDRESASYPEGDEGQGRKRDYGRKREKGKEL
jgi:hypothetical protein